MPLNRRQLVGRGAAVVGSLYSVTNAAAQTSNATPLPDDGLVPVGTPVTDEPKTLSGEIVIAVQSADRQTYQALADAYGQLHPDVDVRVEIKPSDGYQEFIRAQFTAGEPSVSLINGNLVPDLMNAGQLVDFSPYLDKQNPYTGKPWRDSIDSRAIESGRRAVTGELFSLNLERVQVLWFYNKRAFEKAGILAEAEGLAATERNQPTWEQFMQWCDRLRAAGYIPVAIEGDYTSFWEMRFGWLARIYLDQHARDEAELIRARPGDWNFREGIDDVWVYDPLDPTNDDPSKITLNPQRRLAALRDHLQPVQGPKFEALYTNLKKFSDLAAPDDWIGTADAYPLFLTEQAAIRLDVAALLGTFERDIRDLARAAGSVGDDDGATSDQTFELGTFNMPSMSGPEVDAPARTIEVTIGFLSVPKKRQSQNDLEVDFLMWLTSPAGFGLYVENRLDPENLDSPGISGPPAVKDVQLPDQLAAKLAKLKPIGNCEKPTAALYRARGVADYQPSVRDWVELTQRYFTDDLDLPTYLSQYQESVDRHFPEILTHLNLTPEDLDDPTKKPVNFP